MNPFTHLYPETNINSVSRSRYPPPIIVKHHIWYFPDADFFLSSKGVVFGLHLHHFAPSEYFQLLLNPVAPNNNTPLGTTCLRPLPFDDLEHEPLTIFLYALYYPQNFLGTVHEWRTVRFLSIGWGFDYLAGVALRQLLTIQRSRLPILHRVLLVPLPYSIQQQIACRTRLYKVVINDDDSDEGLSDVVSLDSDDEGFLGDESDLVGG